MQLSFERLATDEEARECARLMSSSEPWITLKRDFDAALRLVQDPIAEVWIARSGGAFSGFAVIRMQGALVGYIQSIVFKPETRGNGFGTEFIKFLEARIFSQHPNVFICCSSFNSRALELYKRLGYEKVGEFLDYIVRGHSEILLRKTTGPITEFF